jgi:hypothetical protein
MNAEEHPTRRANVTDRNNMVIVEATRVNWRDYVFLARQWQGALKSIKRMLKRQTLQQSPIALVGLLLQPTRKSAKINVRGVDKSTQS